MGLLEKIKDALFEKEQEESAEEITISEEEKICAYCNKPGADKKWAGQWWHKKCLRKLRKEAKGLL